MWSHRRVLAFAGLLASWSCERPPPQAADSPEVCRDHQARLSELLVALPEQSSSLRGRPDLPVSSLSGVVGSGHVLDIAEQGASLDGEPLPGSTSAQRIQALRERLTSAAAPARAEPLYLTTAANLDARTLRTYLAAVPERYTLLLVFRAPAPPADTSAGSDPTALEKLVNEPDLERRRVLADALYREHARCPAVTAALAGVNGLAPSERWPALRRALIDAVPRCACGDLDAPALSALVTAEQRGSAAALAAVPFDFMRDERCGASFELTPVQSILTDVERFDETFAGQYGPDALVFEPVVTNQRLLGYLCQALPGETLASLARARRTFYWRIEGQGACQGWRFEPLAPGSPMGTWRREEGREPLAVHYWQGAEEIRLYGPVPPEGSKPTDERQWSCSQDFRMRGVDARSIELETGRWFFTREACEAGEAAGAFPGCIAELAGAPARPETPSAAPVAPSSEPSPSVEPAPASAQP